MYADTANAIKPICTILAADCAFACEPSESGGILFAVSGSLAVMPMALRKLPAILSVRLGLAEESAAAPTIQLSPLMLYDSGTRQRGLLTHGR